MLIQFMKFNLNQILVIYLNVHFIRLQGHQEHHFITHPPKQNQIIKEEIDKNLHFEYQIKTNMCIRIYTLFTSMANQIYFNNVHIIIPLQSLEIFVNLRSQIKVKRQY